ncbi:MAG: hypothetical protein BMS9Abin37_0809 [Acidobacteriota bacterium]|nr:MAG: hypothetical protein BMS9Abin37_0809 [Acidobacteriota bacterium]
MKTVVNKTRAPLRIPLPRGKSLHLGPNKTGQIADGAEEHAALKKLVDAGKVEIFDGGDSQRGASGESTVTHETTHGHAKSGIRKSGDR